MTTMSAAQANHSHTATAITTPVPSGSHGGAVDPLRGLDADEIISTREVLAAAGLIAETTRFVYVGVDEPDKADVLAGGDLPRVIRALLLDHGAPRVCRPAVRPSAISVRERTQLTDR